MATQGLVELVQLLDGRSPTEVRSICIEALRRWQRDAPGQRIAQMHGALGLYAARLMLEDRPLVHVDPNVAKEPFIYNQNDQALAWVMDFVWWLVRAALARPQFDVDSAGGLTGGGLGGPPLRTVVAGTARVGSLHFTDAGIRLLTEGDEHPLSPGFLRRFRERNSDIPDEVILLVEDSQACLEVRLMRPAVVLLGLAYETAVLRILEKLTERAILSGKVPETAAKRIAKLRSTLPILEYRDDERSTATAAIDFADHLRIRRNDASHPVESWPFYDHDEGEELLISAARHLQFLWAIAGRTLRPRVS